MQCFPIYWPATTAASGRRQPRRAPAYSRLPADKRPADVFCFRYWRTVSKDNVVPLEGRAIESG
jgi:hypothetical protein